MRGDHTAARTRISLTLHPGYKLSLGGDGACVEMA
jgi:hypothetical protein